MKNSTKLLTTLTLATLSTLGVHAGSHTWSGASSVYFSNPANWSSGGAPTAGEQDVYLVFPPLATRYTSSNNITGLNVKGITFAGDNYWILGNPITMVGAGVTNITCSGNQNAVSAPLVLGGSNLTINVASSKMFFLSSAVSGAGGLTMTGAGTLRLNGQEANSYTGPTYVNGGTMELARSPYDAIVGPLVIGTPIGSPGTVSVRSLFTGQIASTAPVTINYTGVWNMTNVTEWIGGLTMGGGLIQTGTGQLGLLGDVNVLAGTATITGNVWLYYSNRVFNAVPGGTLNINAVIDDVVGTAGIIKTGAGAVNLHAANLFSGPVRVSQGYLGVNHDKAFGASSGLTVTNNGIVQLFNVGITNILATLSGNGNGNGCLRAFGTNVWTDAITLAGNSGIQPFALTDLLTINGPISGNGNLNKLGSGTLNFAGTGGNFYSGTTMVSLGTLQLSKSNAVAIPGTLVIGNATNSANSSSIRLMRSNQIDDRAEVTVNASGGIDFTGTTQASETIGSLSGVGNLYLGFNSLAAGSNNISTTFGGEITGAPAASFIKQGNGTLTVSGNGGLFFGNTQVSGGRLAVNGSLASSTVMVAPSATVAGDGVTGVLGAYGGKIAPGNSAGLLHSANFGMSSASVFEVELEGPTAGITYDQIAVTGFVNLGNADLSVLLGFNSAVSNKFLIIANDGNDTVVNTFKNLSEGATFFAGNAQFQISYQGGDGNDVELTQVGVAAPPQIDSVIRSPDGLIQINATGVAGFGYDVEANGDLGTTNWVKIGSAQSDPNGLISFSDLGATNYPMRFYRLKGN